MDIFQYPMKNHVRHRLGQTLVDLEKRLRTWIHNSEDLQKKNNINILRAP